MNRDLLHCRQILYQLSYQGSPWYFDQMKYVVMTGGIRFTKGCSYLFFKWRIIALQGCVGFCQQQCKPAISIHVSPPCWTSPHPAPHHTPLGYHRAEGWAPWVIQQLPLAMCVTYGNVYISMLLSQFVPSFLSTTVSASLFSMWVSPFLKGIFLSPQLKAHGLRC